MMKHFPLLSFFISVVFSPNTLAAQPQTIFYRAWAQTSATLETGFTNHVVTLAGPSGETYVAASTLNSSGTYSMILSKYQSTGTLVWDEEFTADTLGNVHAGAMAFDASGNIVVTGSAYNGSTNGYDLYVAKYNTSGAKLWHRLHNGPANSYDFGAALACDTNGDIFVTGGAFQSALDMNAVTIRYNSSGSAQWTSTWDNANLTDACGTITLDNGEVIVTGFSQTNISTWEYLIIKYNASTGARIGSYVTNQGGTTIERVTAVAFDAAGNIYITGAMGATGAGLNVKTVKLDEDLNILWAATWNGASNQDDVGRGIAVDTSGDVHVAGYTTAGDDRDALLLRYSSAGTLAWVRTHDAGGADDEFAGLALPDDGAVFAGGYVTREGNKDFYAALYDDNGTAVWSEAYNGLYNRDDEAVQVTPDGAGNFLLAGPGEGAVLTVKYARHTLVLPAGEGVTAPFVENRGQVLNTDMEAENDIRYYTRQLYPNVYIFGDQVSYVFAHIDTVPATADTMVRLDLSFYDAAPGRDGAVAGLERQEYHHNYYLGHIPEGRERVPLDNKVLHPGIYDNIDALYGQGPDGLFIRLICKPGSDPDDIRLLFDGQTALTVETDGSLTVATALESLLLSPPEAMTIDDEGQETEITAWQPAYSIDTNGLVRISKGSYDSTKTLVIVVGGERDAEPCLVYWSTYFGETQNDVSKANGFDQNGYMYATGETKSVNFPTLNSIFAQLSGGSDIFISRFKQPDVLNWSTYYGGNNDIPNFWSVPIETGHDIACDNFGNVYISGRTSARDFPFVSSGVYNDDGQFPGSWYSRGFIIKFDQTLGTALWGSYFGDPERQFDAVTTIEALDNGNIIVGGFSIFNGFNYPQTSGMPIVTPSGAFAQTLGAAYIAELSGFNEILWSTKLVNDEIDQFYAVTVNDIDTDGNGNIYLIGTIGANTTGDHIPTGSSNNLNYGGYIDAFIMKFTADRALDYSFFLGGEAEDWGNSINCVADGYYVTGTTASSNFPIQAFGNASDPLINDNTLNGYDIFVGKFTNAGAQLWMRFLGGEGADEQSYAERICYSAGCNTGGSATKDENGNLYLVGRASHTFPTLPPANSLNSIYYHPYINGYNQTGGSTSGYDAFLTVIEGSGNEMIFSTFWGGYNSTAALDFEEGYSVSTYSGERFMVYFTGMTDAHLPDIPLCHESDIPYFQDVNAGKFDGFQSKIYLTGVSKASGLAKNLIQIDINPNPTDGMIYIIFPEDLFLEIGSISIIDVTGKVLIRQIENKKYRNRVPLDLSSLSSGYYILGIETNGIFIVNSIVKI